MDEPLPELRIGDRERREIDERLRMALEDGMLTLTEYEERSGQCWAARTRSDLDLLTRDLPDRPSEPTTAAVPAPVEPAPAAPAEPMHRHRFGRGLFGIAVVAVGIYAGVSVLGAGDGVSVFGSREVRVAATQDRVDVGMAFGSVDVVVPDNVRVRPTGTIVFGSTDCEQACRADPNLPEIVVDGNGAFGSVDILTQAEFDQKAASKDSDNRDNDDKDKNDN